MPQAKTISDFKGELLMRWRGPCVLLLWYILLSYQASPSQGAYEHYCDADSRSMGQNCGQQLADMLQGICNRYGGFHGLVAKRSQDDDNELLRIQSELLSKIHADNDQIGDRQEAGKSKSPFLSRMSAMSYLGGVSKRQGTIQGLSCECCQNQCNINELKEYCLLPSVSLWAFKRSPPAGKTGPFTDDADNVPSKGSPIDTAVSAKE